MEPLCAFRVTGAGPYETGCITRGAGEEDAGFPALFDRHEEYAALLGDVAYNALVRINALMSRMRRRLGIAGYWSLAGYAKRKVKSAVSFIYDFEDSVMHEARSRGVDGVICGHIHAVAQRTLDGLVYMNCGDWVDSCTAIVEHADGRFAIVDWGQFLRTPGARMTVPVAEEVLGH